ncbi:uncharacterized protein N7459_007766 [Penicillium hispanicum]|uniref:uncharacterized protein n=1 Tax=Penicillium hispanicum TaxID=1080232 RepID=UPI00254087EF|nr:uncharacterized protein N7459_007766 [Penicillium hispanicum]KAJ5578802.1 hypothetical protein N7459_007766 [Penicillium hispanicum]
MTTIGTPVGPFFMGFVTKHIGVQWNFWIFAIINLCEYNLAGGLHHDGFFDNMSPWQITLYPLSWRDFSISFLLVKHPRVLTAACAYAVTFCYGNNALIVEIPIVFGGKFHFDAQQIGLCSPSPLDVS